MKQIIPSRHVKVALGVLVVLFLLAFANALRPLFIERTHLMGMVYPGEWPVVESRAQAGDPMHTFFGPNARANCASGAYEIDVTDISGFWNPQLTLRLVSDFGNHTVVLHAGDEIMLPHPCSGQLESIGKVKSIDPALWWPSQLRRFWNPDHDAILELYDSWITNPLVMKQQFPPEVLP